LKHRQSEQEDIVANKKDQSQQGMQDLRDQSAEPGAGTRADSAQKQGGDGSRQSGFLHSPPEANVFPAGKPQADNPGRHGGQSAAGTPDEGRLGGSGGTSAAGTTGNDPDR
jgi:hypothetical protein